MIQKLYADDNRSKRLRLYQDPQFGHLWLELQHSQSDIVDVNKIINKICNLFVTKIRRSLGDSDENNVIVPVFILRGGLFFLYSFQKVQNEKPFGIVLMERSTLNLRPSVLYFNIPSIRRNQVYLIMDLIANSGATIVETIRSIYPIMSGSTHGSDAIHLSSPFMTQNAVNNIFNTFPSVIIHTIWNDLKVGSDGRLIGIEFDGGDAACGGGQRVHWRRYSH